MNRNSVQRNKNQNNKHKQAIAQPNPTELANPNKHYQPQNQLNSNQIKHKKQQTSNTVTKAIKTLINK